MTIKVKGQDYELDELHITGNLAADTETTINFDKESEFLRVYTSDDSTLTKIKRVMKVEGSDWKIVDIIKRNDGSISGIKATASKNMFSFRSKKVELSDEVKEKMVERFKKSRASEALKKD